MAEAGRTALVSGATGFVGSHLTTALVARGWQVHALVRDSVSADRLSGLPGGVVVHPDTGAVADLARLSEEVGPDVCFHLATHFVASHTPDDIAPLVEANLAFGMRVAEALSGSGQVLIVNTGTAWQHYEGRPYSPTSLYAATKQAFEDVLRYYAEAGRLRVVNLKLFDTYGPGDTRPKLLNLLAAAARSGERLPLSPGEQHIDLVHVDDVVEALLGAARVDGGGPEPLAFAVSSGSPVTVRELVALFQRATGLRVAVDWGAHPYRPREMLTPWRVGPPVPGWAPRVGLEEGLAATFGRGGSQM